MKQSMSQKACDWFPLGASTSWCWEWPGPSPAVGKERSIRCPCGKELGGSTELLTANPVPPGSTPSPTMSQECPPGPCPPSALQPRGRTAHTAKDEAEWRGATRLCVRVSPRPCGRLRGPDPTESCEGLWWPGQAGCARGSAPCPGLAVQGFLPGAGCPGFYMIDAHRCHTHVGVPA